jgi:hypothetical protein
VITENEIFVFNGHDNHLFRIAFGKLIDSLLQVLNVMLQVNEVSGGGGTALLPMLSDARTTPVAHQSAVITPPWLEQQKIIETPRRFDNNFPF